MVRSKVPTDTREDDGETRELTRKRDRTLESSPFALGPYCPSETPWNGISLMMWWFQRWLLLGSRVIPHPNKLSESTAADATTLLEIEDKLLVPFGLKHDVALVGLERALRTALAELAVSAPRAAGPAFYPKHAPVLIRFLRAWDSGIRVEGGGSGSQGERAQSATGVEPSHELSRVSLFHSLWSPFCNIFSWAAWRRQPECSHQSDATSRFHLEWTCELVFLLLLEGVLSHE